MHLVSGSKSLHLEQKPTDGTGKGYNFWLNKLNSFGGNFQNADMVKAFLTSGEYRGRFPK